MSPTLEKRFWEKVELTDGCWLWTGLNAGRDGAYGYLWNHKGSSTLAHKISYELNIGEVPEGLQIDHLCENQKCVNPSHLEAVTHTENMHRWQYGRTRRRGYCVKDLHEFTPENTTLIRDKNGKTWRACKVCDRDRKKRVYDAKKLEKQTK